MVKNKFKLFLSVLITLLFFSSGIAFAYRVHYGFQERLFWNVFSAVSTALSAIALIITAIFIYKQASATKEMVEFQWTPRVVVGMRTVRPQREIKNEDEEKMGTQFIFYNYTQSMVWIWRKIDLKIDGVKIDEAIANQWLGVELIGKKPLPVKGPSLERPLCEIAPTASYDFLFNIPDITNKTITATLEYWSAYTPEEQKNPKIFGPIPYDFSIKEGWTIGGGWGIPF